EIAQREGREEEIISETSRARRAEEVANARLKELELKRAVERSQKPDNTPTQNEVRIEDAERQRRFDEQQRIIEEEALSKGDGWVLPLEGSDAEKRGIVERFRKDIEYCGMTFCLNKYHVTPIQIKAEAARLKLKINWDRVK